MNACSHRGGVIVAVIITGVLALGALAVALLAPSDATDGPADLAWDRVACAHCQMHVGEPAFAAQARDADGRVLAFDDPGCLLAYEDAHGGPLAGRYFHDVDGAGWIAAADAVFVARTPTPMAYGFGAAPASAPAGVDLAEVRRLLVERGLLRRPGSTSGATAARAPGDDEHGHGPQSPQVHP